MALLLPDENKTDEELVTLTIEGNKAAFGILAERYIPKLIRYGRKFLAGGEDIEDQVQDVLLKSYVNLKSFDPSRKFSPWIYRIAHNCFVNSLRARDRLPLALPLDTLLPYAVEEDTPQNEAERREMKEMIEKSMSLLSAQYREVLTLYYMEELGYEEISEVLSVPIGTVGVRLSRARAQLKKTFEKNGIAYE